MIDFWVAVLLTAIVSILTVLADWVASRVIVGARTIRALGQILRAGLSERDIVGRVAREIDRYKASQTSALAWGADLATVAISMDLAALGIWVHSPNLFPFFARFNSIDTSWDLPVWLIVIGVHVVLLLASLVFKHNHAEIVAVKEFADVSAFPREQWFTTNGWMFAANSTGTISLLVAMVVFTNAI